MDHPLVLVIDDDRDSAGYFAAVLNMMAYEVEVVHSAKTALARLSATVPHIIILDIRLGNDIGGEDILYQVRSNPRFDNTRVIVITGYPNMVDLVSNLADLILIKPVEVDLLQTLVTRISSIAFTPKRLSFRDPVTLLFNKDFFFTRLELAFERARRRKEFYFAVLVIEICLPDKPDMRALGIDDSFEAIKVFAERMKQNLRPTDAIARLAGWKFAILLEDLRAREDTAVIIERMKKLLAEPLSLGDTSYSATATFGVAQNNNQYHLPQELFEAAEKAFTQTQAANRSEQPAD